MTDLAPAIATLRSGGIIAYPTEAVWGLGCDPFNESAVHRLLTIKQRPVEKGLILVAAHLAQLTGLADWDALPPARRDAVQSTWPGPHTWIIPATARVPHWITGDHTGVAMRVSAHPIVVALCEAFGGPIVSTSANLAGAEPARSRDQLDPALLERIDAVVDEPTGGLENPTGIRVAATGEVLRG